MFETIGSASIIVQVIVYIIIITGTIIITNIGHIINWSRNRKNKNIVRDNIHINCPHYDNFLLTKEREISIAVKRHELQYHEKLDIQMVIMERAVDRIKSLAIDVIDTLSHNNLRDLRHYNMIMEYVNKSILKTIRVWIKKNSLLEKNEKEFLEYAEETSESILREMSGIMDVYYSSEDFSVPRVETKKYFAENHNDEFIDIFKDALYNIRKVESEYRIKINGVRNEEIIK